MPEPVEKISVEFMKQAAYFTYACAPTFSFSHVRSHGDVETAADKDVAVLDTDKDGCWSQTEFAKFFSEKPKDALASPRCPLPLAKGVDLAAKDLGFATPEGPHVSRVSLAALHWAGMFQIEAGGQIATSQKTENDFDTNKDGFWDKQELEALVQGRVKVEHRNGWVNDNLLARAKGLRFAMEIMGIKPTIKEPATKEPTAKDPAAK
jgi:hypothetical protein